MQMIEKKSIQIPSRKERRATSDDATAGPSDEDIKYAIVAPDGGWGWVVVAAAFYCNFLVDGLILTFGIYLPVISEEYGQTEASVAFISSLAFGMHYIPGPVCAAMCTFYGIRTTTFVGSIMVGISTTWAAFDPPYWLLVFLLGFIRGVGMCFIFMPSIVITATYFSRYRIQAMGIVFCSTGAGTAIFGYFGTFMLAKLDWRYAHLIFGAASFLCAFVGLAFRQLEPVPLKTTRHVEPMEIHTLVFDTFESDTEDDLDDQAIVFMRRAKEDTSSMQTNALEGNEIVMEDYVSKLYERELMVKRVPTYSACCRRKKRVVLVHPETKKELLSTLKPLSKNLRSRLKIRARKFVPLRSIRGLGQCEKFRKSMKESVDFGILKNVAFIVYSISGILLATATIIVFTFEKARALDRGCNGRKCNDEEAMYTLVGMGITNMIWRLLLGAISQIPYISYKVWNILGTVIAGVALATTGISHSLGFEIFFAISVGFGLGCFAVYRPVLLLDMVGVENASNGLGISILISGSFAIAGPPFAGWLLQITDKNYDVIFWFAGSLYILGGLLYIPYTIETYSVARPAAAVDTTSF